MAEARPAGWVQVTNRHMRDVDDVFDVVVLHDPLEPGTWALLRERVEPGALIVSRAAHPPDADLETVSVAGLELGVVLR